MFIVKLGRQPSKFLEALEPKVISNCLISLRMLEENPYLSRSKCDIKKLSGKHGVYRLRIGKIRFTYRIFESNIIIDEAFFRERGY